jgi:hypothetical protein
MKTVIVYLLLIHTPADQRLHSEHSHGLVFAAYENSTLCEVKAIGIREDLAGSHVKATVTCEPVTLVSP